jgi:hypothetical protein
MWGTRRTRGALLTGALAIGGAAFVSAAAPHATAVEPKEPAPVTVTEDLGILRLEMRTSTLRAIFSPADPGAADVEQTFTRDSRCGISSSEDEEQLLAITANGSGPGSVGNNMGVRNSNSCGLLGVPAAMISQSEVLTLALGSYFDQATLDVLVKISRAELDVAAIHRSNLGVSLDSELLADDGFTTHVLSNNRGSFVDQGLKDNNRVVVDGSTPETSFRTIGLKSVPTNVPAALAGVSLNGGGDGDFGQYAAKGLIGPLGSAHATPDTIFSLVTETDYADSLSCDDSAPSAAIGEGAAVDATVTWTPPDECTDEGVALDFDITADGVILNKAYLNMTPEQIAALRFQVTITWTPATPAELDRQISFTPPFEDDSFEPVQWCGALDGGVPARPNSTNAQSPAQAPWCLIDNHETLQDDGLVAQVQVYDGLGDPMWK